MLDGGLGSDTFLVDRNLPCDGDVWISDFGGPSVVRTTEAEGPRTIRCTGEDEGGPGGEPRIHVATGAADDLVTSRVIGAVNWIGAGFAVFEKLAAKHSAGGRHCFGDSLTMADAWLIPQVYNARRYALDLAPYPLIAAIDRHCTALPAFAAAHPDRQSDSPSGRQ